MKQSKMPELQEHGYIFTASSRRVQLASCESGNTQKGYNPKMLLPSRHIVFLNSLYDFVRDQRKSGDEGLRLAGSAYGKEYSRRCKIITENVDEVAGFYVWGRYDCKRYWRSIYIGKAGYKRDRKNLRKRILEELKDERAFVWRYVYDEAEVLAICQRIHGGKYTGSDRC
jgi:hypothetical protein